MVARLVRDQKVVGSSPVTSTILGDIMAIKAYYIAFFVTFFNLIKTESKKFWGKFGVQIINT